MTHNSWPGAYTIKIYFLAQWQRWLSFHNPDQKMVFLDINLTKDSSYSQSHHWWILQKTKLNSGIKNLYKNSTHQENSIIFMKSIL